MLPLSRALGDGVVSPLADAFPVPRYLFGASRPLGTGYPKMRVGAVSLPLDEHLARSDVTHILAR